MPSNTTGKQDWSKILAMFTLGGYNNRVELSDSSALLSLVGLTLLEPEHAWVDFSDSDDIEAALSLAIAEITAWSGMVFNGNFYSNIAGWNNIGWAEFYWDDEALRVVSTAPTSWPRAHQDIGMIPGDEYSYRITCEKVSGGNLLFQHGQNFSLETMTSSGTHEGDFFASADLGWEGIISFKGAGVPCDWKIDSVFVEPKP